MNESWAERQKLLREEQVSKTSAAYAALTEVMTPTRREVAELSGIKWYYTQVNKVFFEPEISQFRFAEDEEGKPALQRYNGARFRVPVDKLGHGIRKLARYMKEMLDQWKSEGVDMTRVSDHDFFEIFRLQDEPRAGVKTDFEAVRNARECLMQYGVKLPYDPRLNLLY